MERTTRKHLIKKPGSSRTSIELYLTKNEKAIVAAASDKMRTNGIVQREWIETAIVEEARRILKGGNHENKY